MNQWQHPEKQHIQLHSVFSQGSMHTLNALKTLKCFSPSTETRQRRRSAERRAVRMSRCVWGREKNAQLDNSMFVSHIRRVNDNNNIMTSAWEHAPAQPWLLQSMRLKKSQTQRQTPFMGKEKLWCHPQDHELEKWSVKWDCSTDLSLLRPLQDDPNKGLDNKVKGWGW